MTEKTGGKTTDVPHVDAREESERVEELRQDIQHTREQLGETIEQLVHKTDIKERAEEQLRDTAQRMRTAGAQLAEATVVFGRRWPVPLGAAALLLAMIGAWLWRRHH